jgi:hypothetical protein
MEIPSIAATAIGLFVLQDTSYQVPIALSMGVATYLYLQSMVPVDPDMPVYLESTGCTNDGTACLY